MNQMIDHFNEKLNIKRLFKTAWKAFEVLMKII